MSRTSSREERAAAFVRRMNAERVDIELHDRLSISLPLAWLALQGVLFLAASMICSCCALSSYLWGSESPYLTLPSLGLPAAAVTDARLGTSTPTISPSRLSTATIARARTPVATTGHTGTPVATAIVPTRTASVPPPAGTVVPGAPTPSLSTPSVLEALSPSPISSLTPTSGPSEEPTRSLSLQPTSAFSPSMPTSTPQSVSFSTDLRIAQVVRTSLLSLSDDEEHIVIENGGKDQDMARWMITNDRLDTYRFPEGFVLPAGASVRVWTKSGTDTETDLYWGSEKAVWGGHGGTAYLREPSGTLVALLHW
jgi:hypothetical protein